MGKRTEKFLDGLLVLLLVYVFGIFLLLIFSMLRILGRIKICKKERFPAYFKRPLAYRRGLIVLSNHPSLLEPVLIPLLFWRDWLLHPLRLTPWNTPDEKNYYNHWYWSWVKLRMIPIARGDSRQGLKAFFKIKSVLESKGIVILFGEGGRTSKGKEGDFLYSSVGRRIRNLEEGVGFLVSKTEARVLPIWIDGAEEIMPIRKDGKLFSIPRFWKGRVKIKIGNIVSFKRSISKEEVTQKLSVALLELADEPC